MQVQSLPAASIASYPGTMPAIAQTQAAVIPQAQPSVLVPAQQQVPNNHMLYAAAPGAVPVQGMVPQVVPHDPTQYQAGVVPANPAVTPGAPVAGQTDLSAAPYGVPGIQPIVSSLAHSVISFCFSVHTTINFVTCWLTIAFCWKMVKLTVMCNQIDLPVIAR